MESTISTVITYLRQSIYHGVAVVLIVLYALQVVQPQFYHSVLHEEHSETTHSIEEEADPCHRNIFHNIASEPCGHSSHIIENEKCSFLEVAINTPHIFSAQIFFQQHRFISTYVEIKTTSLPVKLSVYIPARAPPTA